MDECDVEVYLMYFKKFVDYHEPHTFLKFIGD